MVFLIGIL